MEMEVTELDGNVMRIRLVGRLDAPGADSIDTRFTAATVALARNTVIDLAGVTFIASMGIRLLISCARALDRKGVKLVLFGAQDLVQTVLEQMAIDQLVSIVANEQQALAQFAA